MNRWADNLVYPIVGDFHIHTCYSDGADTIDAYCQRAKNNGLTHIAFTEHVRRNLDYDFNEYLRDIKTAREIYPDLTIFAGCETKVIDCDGNLDVQESVVDRCDFVTAVFHSFPWSDKDTYLKALKAMLINPVVDVWGHPTLFAKRHGFRLDYNEIEDIIKTCISSGIIIEINIKHNLPDMDFLKIARREGAIFLFGSDAHAVDDLLDKGKLVKLWEKLNRMC